MLASGKLVLTDKILVVAPRPSLIEPWYDLRRRELDTLLAIGEKDDDRADNEVRERRLLE